MGNLYGWTGSFLNVDLGSKEISKTSSRDYAEGWIGGRLMASRLYWDEVSSRTGALDADNVLMFLTGPLTGSTAVACSRWVIGAKSPCSYPDQYGFGNAGGFLGAALKFAGLDGLIVRGKARSPSYVLIEGGTAAVKDARGLQGLSTEDTMKKLREQHGGSARVVCIGPAGESKVRFAIAVTDRGGSLSNGMGAVMGSKNLKAVVVKGSGKVAAADPQKLQEINKRIRSLRKGQNESLYMTEPMLQGIDKGVYTPCYACPAGCMRSMFKHTSGREEVRQTCAAAFFYTPWDQLFHGEATENPFLATSLCDRSGLCTGEMSNVINWLHTCREAGVLSEADTGLPLDRIGSLEFIEALVDKIVRQDGFGELLAQGTRRASIEKGAQAEQLALKRVTPSGYVDDSYGPRLLMATAMIYATEARNPIVQLHEFSFTVLKWMLWHTTGGGMSSLSTEVLRKIAKRAWGSEAAADFSTYDGKARAAVAIQNRQHAKESMVACDRFYPLLDSDQTEDGMGDPTLVPQLFQAVTGNTLSEADYYKVGERSMNLQRAIMLREGWEGRPSDQLNDFHFTETLESEEGMVGLFNPDLEFPSSGDEIISRKGQVLGREDFRQMADEYYRLRGWDIKSGLQTRAGLNDLELSFTCGDLEKIGRLAK